MHKRFPGVLLGVALLAAGAADRSLAQAYPNKPVTVVLPLQVGSASDIAVRVVCEQMGASLKQSFVVENVSGAGGLVGTDRVAKARPDGYTLAALNNSILSILPNIQKSRVAFDPFSDFVPVRGIASIPTFLGVSADVPVKNVRELIDYARANPGALNYSSGGAGSPQHLATEMFLSMTGTRMTHVPYKGATAAAAALAAGQVQVMFIAHSLALPFLPGGKVRLIAFGGMQRSAALPGIPTVHESGVPGYDYASWIALFAPKGTPPEIVERLRAEAAQALAAPGVRDRLARSGLELWNVPAADLPRIIREDYARWERVVREADIKSD